MKFIWIALAIAVIYAMVGLYLLRARNVEDDRPVNVTANCEDSYPPVVTEWQLPEGNSKVTVSCKPDRFLRRDVPGHSL